MPLPNLSSLASNVTAIPAITAFDNGCDTIVYSALNVPAGAGNILWLYIKDRRDYSWGTSVKSNSYVPCLVPTYGTGSSSAFTPYARYAFTYITMPVIADPSTLGIVASSVTVNPTHTLRLTAYPSEGYQPRFSVMALTGVSNTSDFNLNTTNFPWLTTDVETCSTAPINLVQDTDYIYLTGDNRILFHLTTGFVDDQNPLYVDAVNNRYEFPTIDIPNTTNFVTIPSSTSMTARISSSVANNLINWQTFNRNSTLTNYSSSISLANGAYEGYATPLVFNSSTGNAGTYTILITANNDINPIYITTVSAGSAVRNIQAYQSSETQNHYIIHYGDVVTFLPQRPSMTVTSYTENTITLSAHYIDSMGTNYIIPGGDVPNITWTISTTAGLTPGHPFNSSNQAIGVQTISFGCPTTQTYRLTADIDDVFNRTPCVSSIYFNDTIGIKSTTDTNKLTATAIYQHMVLPIEDVYPIKPLNWFSNLGFINYTGTAATYGTINKVATTNAQLTSTFTYTVCSGNLSATSVFRPYLPFDGITSALTGVQISKTNVDRDTTFSIRMLGVSAGTHIHNIDPNYSLSYDEAYTNLNMVPQPDNYVNVVVTNPLYSGSYTPITYTISANATSVVGNPASGLIQVVSYPYVSESSFYPVLQIDSNDPVSHLYMITATDIDLKVDPSTILIPSGATGNYLFTLNGSPQGGTFSSTANLKSKIANYATTGMSAATAVLSVSANYGSDVIVRSYQTTITFVSANNITTSDIKVYPEYKWDINNWKKVINTSTYELSSTSPAFIYGNGRTETFVLSTRDNTDIGRYDWAINRGSGYNYIGSSRVLNTNIKTLSANNETIGVRVTGYTEIGDIPLPAVTITNAISVSLIPIPTLSADIAMPIEVGAPDSLIITSSKSVMSGTTAIPINIRLTTAIYNISCSYWTTSSIALGLGSQDLSYISIPLNVSDIGTPVLSIPKFESTNLIVSILPTLIYEYLNHPTWNDWETSLPQPTTGNITSGINAFPINPYYYTPNKYLELNGNSSIEVTMTNIVPFNNLISGFDWESGTTVSSISNFDPFKGIYNEENVYNVVMTSKLVSATPIVTTNLDALYIVDNYPVYDPEINRQVKVPIGPLPYPCGIGSNEWLTCENINLSFKKIYDNLMYLYKQTKIYDEPPTEYIGWLGSILMADDTTRLRWHINSTGLDYGYTTPQISVDKELNNLQDCIVKDNVVFVSNASSVSIISPEFTPSIINTQTRRDIIDDFNFIKTIQVDNDDKRIYVLDTKDVNNHYSGSKNKLSVFIYNNDPVDNGWELLYSWGGFGAATSTLKFNNPQDMFLDGNNILWVADTDNLVIKKYYRNGNWIKTISSSKFTTSNKPVSLCVDSSNNLQVLCNNKVVVFDYNGNYKYEYDVPNTVPYIKIRPSADDDLIYITSNNNTIKCNINGTIQLPLNNYSMSLSYVLDNRSVYQDEYRNLYICQKNHILKYNDTIKYISLVEDSLLDNLWTLDEIYIKNQEYIQDWVVNKALNRLWDNIEIFRRSILGKLSYERIVREEPFGESWETLVPRDRSVCNIDWWPSFMHSRDYMTRYCYVIPRIRTFLPFERLSLPNAKDDVFVGINELVTADVLNRTLCQLQQNLLVIKELLKQPDDKSDELCDGIDEPIDVVLDNNALSLSACYPELFQINPCLYAVNINGILNPCTGVETNYTLDIISTATCSAGIQQYNWYVDNILLSAINPADDDQTFRYTFNSTDPVTISMELSANNIVYTKKNVIVTPKSC